MDESSMNKGHYALDGKYVYGFDSDEEAQEYRAVVRKIRRGVGDSTALLIGFGLVLLVLGLSGLAPPEGSVLAVISALPIFFSLIPVFAVSPQFRIREEMRSRSTCHQYLKSEVQYWKDEPVV